MQGNRSLLVGWLFLSNYACYAFYALVKSGFRSRDIDLDSAPVDKNDEVHTDKTTSEDMYRDMQRAMHACGAELPGCDVAPERLDDEKPMNETKIDEKRDNEVNEKHADEMMLTETQACRERLRSVP